MKIRILSNVIERNSSEVDFQSVVKKITSSDLEDRVDAIHLEPDSNKKKRLKKKLPAFYPCLDYSDPDNIMTNGIVHIDIDKKDNPSIDFDELKNSFTSLPETVFCFFSPNKGLKIGIQTDFLEDFTNDSKQLYKSVYTITKDLLHSKSKFVDDAGVVHVTCSCFYSYDPEIYYNPEAIPLSVTSQFPEPPKYEHIMSDNFEDSFIEALFKAVPSDVSYNDWQIANYMVLHHLPHEAESLILNHWGENKAIGLVDSSLTRTKNL